jgi:hypothetical protein
MGQKSLPDNLLLRSRACLSGAELSPNINCLQGERSTGV